jgi:hypothetical protein
LQLCAEAAYAGKNLHRAFGAILGYVPSALIDPLHALANLAGSLKSSTLKEKKKERECEKENNGSALNKDIAVISPYFLLMTTPQAALPIGK